MADNDSRVVIGVEADTKQADKEFDKLKKKMEQTSSNIKSKMGASSGVSSNASQSDASSDSNKFESTPQMENPNNWGRTAGKLFTAEFITRLANKGVDMYRLLATDPSTGNDRVDTIASAASGGIEGAAYGAMSGGIKGGIFGAIFGAAFSGLMAEIEHEKRIQDEFNQYELQKLGSRIGVHTAVGKGASQQVESMMTLEERRDFYRQQSYDLIGGPNGINHLETRINKLMLDGEKDSQKYKLLAQIRDNKQTLANEYEFKFAQESMRFNFKKYEANDLIDSYAKMGIEIGNQVNVEDLQQRQLDAMQGIKDYLKKIAEKMTQMSNSGLDSVYNSFL